MISMGMIAAFVWKMAWAWGSFLVVMIGAWIYDIHRS